MAIIAQIRRIDRETIMASSKKLRNRFKEEWEDGEEGAFGLQ